MSRSYAIVRSGYESSSAAPIEPVGPEMPCNLVSFLATVQSLGLEIPALTWQPALGQLARGGTSGIQKLSVQLESSSAFKVFEYPDDGKKDEKDVYQALISEIIVLGQESLRTHPNIKPVLGICWDPRSDKRVWPVLVSENSGHGNLREFIESTAGSNLPFEARVNICSGVARATETCTTVVSPKAAISESCKAESIADIVHGNIKPSKILIDQDAVNEYVPKAIDLRYATMYAGHGLINMPPSPGWSAPSTRGGERFIQAKSMDAFSFGLVCLCLLFHNAPRPRRFDFSSAAPQGLIVTAYDLVEREETLDEA